MVLHAKYRLRFVPHAFNSLVVEIDSINCHVVRQRFRIHGEPVVLRRDFDPAGFKIFHGLIATAMPELELKRFPAESLS